ncbi:fasciclin domain-containing protein [Sphingomicrobium marinum]|uniref:fasciclin domain-containing protein n=1 Tax=Sphingomicrobium marinum TaxID=1227950 RepID=UPI00223EF65C|nr:fasciclin domain-containing protein [Sphingomicrobium marinum]
MRILITAMAASALALGACASEENPAGNEIAEEGGKLVNAIGADSQFGRAMAAAGLDGILDGPAPYTLIVPSDEAFAALPEGTLPDASTEEGKEALGAILSNHILPGTILSDDVRKAATANGGSASLPTLGEATLEASVNGDSLTLSAGGDAGSVTQADARYDNGVVHRVDMVLL